MITDTKYPEAFRSMFREYDIRGRVCDEELCPENVYRIVKAYSKYLRRRKIMRAVVGYDNRSCSPAFANPPSMRFWRRASTYFTSDLRSPRSLTSRSIT